MRRYKPLTQLFRGTPIRIPNTRPFSNPKCHQITRRSNITLDEFKSHISTVMLLRVITTNWSLLQNQERVDPLLITGQIDHWSALKKWRDIDFIANNHGDAIVPVELGSYAHSQYSLILIKLRSLGPDFRQIQMTLIDFINVFIKEDEKARAVLSNRLHVDVLPIGYLAQHTLFQQVRKWWLINWKRQAIFSPQKELLFSKKSCLHRCRYQNYAKIYRYRNLYVRAKIDMSWWTDGWVLRARSHRCTKILKTTYSRECTRFVDCLFSCCEANSSWQSSVHTSAAAFFLENCTASSRLQRVSNRVNFTWVTGSLGKKSQYLATAEYV